MPAPPARLPQQGALDGVRGMAVLLVFLSHTSGRDMALAPWLDFHGIGHVGVYLFFVLSAYLLTVNLLQDRRVVAFYIRRFCRIAPLYYATLLGVFLWQWHRPPAAAYLSVTGEDAFLRHFAFIEGDGIFWTIPAEVSFYLLLPLLVLLALRTGGITLLWLLATFSCGWLLAIEVAGRDLPSLRIVDIQHATQYLDVFLCGVLAALGRFRRFVPWAGVLFAALVLTTLVCVSKNVLGAGRPWFDLRWWSLLYGIVFAVAIDAVAHRPGALRTFFEQRWLRAMGVLGYSWYLLHMPVFQAVNAAAPDSAVIRFMLATVGIVVLASLTYRFIERPGIALGRWLCARIPAPGASRQPDAP